MIAFHITHCLCYALSAVCDDTLSKVILLLQDGEFIETFLLPYDGLYDALVVIALPSTLTYQLPCLIYPLTKVLC